MARETSERTFAATDSRALRETVLQVVDETPITDIHTHLFAPSFGDLLLYGVDELLTYHYVVAEFFRASAMPYEEFWTLDKRAQADLIWQTLFLERSPISESCRGVVTSLRKLGLDTSARDLQPYREYFRDLSIEDHVTNVLNRANIKTLVMTNDPFDEKERAVWLNDYRADPRFLAALRIDPLLLQWATSSASLRGWGYKTGALSSAKTHSEVRRFLNDWLHRTNACYMAVSLPPTFRYPAEDPCALLLEACVLPVARERNLPFAMMIGVDRAVNPALRLAGDALGRADIHSLERLCAKYPENRFMVTMISRENQHELCVAARKFRNLLVFGCWWFMNIPSLVEEVTRMRLELLGFSMVPQHSDARVLEQVIYKWDHSRQIIASVLAEKYADLVAAGWTVTESEMRRDVARLFGEVFWEFTA